MIDINTRSARLHSDIPQSIFQRMAGNGHMIQQTATDQVMAAIREVAAVRTEIVSARWNDCRGAALRCCGLCSELLFIKIKFRPQRGNGDNNPATFATGAR